MKILFSIIINALILLAIAYLLGPNGNIGVEAGVVLGCGDCGYLSEQALATYFFGGLILGGINLIIKPILKILSLPLFFLFFGLVVFVVNAIILWLLSYIINVIFVIPGISYEINGWVNYIIAVAIFTFLNMFYSLLFNKK
ncbi:MAG: phage holin family protein [Candidatus Gracilibacteria bacterium]|nr:phage holin family protein [Candidatus Gracilibacteria bacterium]